jgi:hypothetical protein
VPFCGIIAICAWSMRTTLDIDDDVLQAAKERARRDKKTTGEVISELAGSLHFPAEASD